MSYQSVNPFNNQKLKDYPSHTDQDIQNALDTAEKILKSDWTQQVDTRIEALRKLANNMREHKSELAKIMTLDMGKLIKQSEGEIESCAKIAEYYADHAKEFLAPVSYETELGEAWVEHHPLGIIMAVEPWNFPFYQLMRVFAPNCAIGNPVLVKHAGIVPQCAEAFEKLVLEAGAPRGVWINLFISSDQVQEIIADPRVQGVALTGSEGAGSAVAEQAGKYIKKSTLELGGNDVFEEFFGPVAQIYVAKDEDEIVSIANDSHYGLGGVIHSQDIERAKKLASRVETGMIWINWFTDTAPELPFGGIKNSGYGHELSIDGFREFTQKRLVVVKSPKE